MAETFPTGENPVFMDATDHTARVLVELCRHEVEEYNYAHIFYKYVRGLLLQTNGNWTEAFALYRTPTHFAGKPVFFHSYDLPGVQNRYQKARTMMENRIMLNNERAETRKKMAGVDESLWCSWVPRKIWPALPPTDYMAVHRMALERLAREFVAKNPEFKLIGTIIPLDNGLVGIEILRGGVEPGFLYIPVLAWSEGVGYYPPPPKPLEVIDLTED